MDSRAIGSFAPWLPVGSWSQWEIEWWMVAGVSTYYLSKVPSCLAALELAVLSVLLSASPP